MLKESAGLGSWLGWVEFLGALFGWFYTQKLLGSGGNYVLVPIEHKGFWLRNLEGDDLIHQIAGLLGFWFVSFVVL